MLVSEVLAAEVLAAVELVAEVLAAEVLAAVELVAEMLVAEVLVASGDGTCYRVLAHASTSHDK